ncbi:hypothetical protein EVAR_46772_1 [Eumeta japonica]|uniref:Uncharacterized protein n=1 Tax=Eumeta variegata TaxID=151549 RepID=A0A4C1XB64_EUMVA|nr:hypothetical protein EVAR_46772_1 [Eumeta japonica]
MTKTKQTIQPVHLTTIGILATIFVHLNDGPLWYKQVGMRAERCREMWWHHAFVPEQFWQLDRLYASSLLLPRALSAATESRNSVTKIKPNTPHSAYDVVRPSVRLTSFTTTSILFHLWKGRVPQLLCLSLSLLGGLTMPEWKGRVPLYCSHCERITHLAMDFQVYIMCSVIMLWILSRGLDPEYVLKRLFAALLLLVFGVYLSELPPAIINC